MWAASVMGDGRDKVVEAVWNVVVGEVEEEGLCRRRGEVTLDGVSGGEGQTEMLTSFTEETGPE